MLCRVRTARSGAVLLEFVRRDALAAIVVALPVPARPDLKALPVGIQGRRAVHRLPDQVPHQAGGRLPPGPDRRPAAHADRLAEALRYQPCSPRCANWLRYGIQPKNARPGLGPGCCKGKAHDAEHLGYAGRRVLVSRKWSGRPIDRTDAWFFADPLWLGSRVGQASSSLITRTESVDQDETASQRDVRGVVLPGSGRCARRMIRRCRGWWWMRPASGSVLSMTS